MVGVSGEEPERDENRLIADAGHWKKEKCMDNSFSLLGMLSTMNWLARGVVVVLALMSIWSLTIAIERIVRFQRAKRESLGIALGVTPLLKQHKLEEAITMASDKKYRHSHLARVLRQA